MRHATAGYGAWLLVLASLIGLVGALFAYFWTGNGIHGSAGALLIVITIVLMFFAAAALTWWPAMPRWLCGVLLFLILIDILGSGFAAYMLEAWYVVAAMVLVLVAWIFHVAADPAPRPVPARA